MTEVYTPRLRYIIGPGGSPLTIADLPPPSTKRWVVRRKAMVVAAVRGGLLSLDDACKRYQLNDRIILLPSDNISVEVACTINKNTCIHFEKKSRGKIEKILLFECQI